MPQTPRREIRIPLDGNIVYAVGFATQGGTVKDISMHGCLVQSDRPPHPASMLSCRILLPGLDEPVEVHLALVQWVLGNHFGLKIVDMFADTQKRLRRFLDDNYVQLARARRGREGPRNGSPEPARSIVASPLSGSLSSASSVQGSLALPGSESRTASGCFEDSVPILPQDLSAFVGWILDARHAFEEKAPLPAPPILEFEEFKGCTQFIQTLLHQSQSSLSRSAEAAPSQGAQQEVIAHLLSQLKKDHHKHALRDALSQLADAQKGHERPSSDQDGAPVVETQAERRVRTRRSAPRVNNRGRAPLSVRLARLTAKFKLPSWLAGV